MSEKLSNKKGGVEEYKVLDEVYDANWRDDIVSEEDESNVMQFETFENESEYENDPADDKKESMELIRRFRKTTGIKTLKSYNLLKKEA